MPLKPPDNHDSPDEQKAKRAEAAESGAEPSWLAANVLNPFANSAALEPYNAVAGAVSGVSGKTLPHVELLSTGHEKTLNTLQTVSSGLGSLVPFLVAAKVAGVPLRGAGAVVDKVACAGVERTAVSRFLVSDSAATVAGGALWGGAKDPGKGETRLGNAVGNAVGFAGFEFGGHLSRNLATPLALSVRGLAGFVGGSGQLVSGDLISGKDISGAEVFKSGLSGAAMSVALPGAKALFGRLSPWRSEAVGRGEVGKPNADSVVPGSKIDAKAEAHPEHAPEVVAKADQTLDSAGVAARASEVLAQAETMNRFGTGLARAFEAMPEAERPAVFQHLLQEARKQPGLGAVDDLSGALRTLSGDSAAAAWKEIAAIHKDRFANGLVNAIDSLPQFERLGAVSHAIDNFPAAYYLPEKLKLVPAKDFPVLAEKVMSMADESFMAKGRLLNEWPQDLMQLNGAERADVVQRTLETAFKLAKRGDETKLQNLWVNLPDKELKAALAEKLNPTDLGKVVFSWAEPDLVESFSRSHPEAVRRLAARDLATTDSSEIRHIQSILQDIKNGESASQVVLKAADAKRHFWFYKGDNAVPQLLGEILSGAPQAEREAVLKSFAEAVTGSGTPYSSGMQLSRLLVGRMNMNAADRPLISEFYVKPINEALADSTLDYTARLNRASQTAAIERMLPLEGLEFRIPDMRMARIETGMTAPQVAQLRGSVESALKNPDQFRSLFGEGPLGKIFPTIFGRHGIEGGIVGRPQHGGHEFVLDDHTLLVLQRVNEHPDMAKLSAKEQDNVRWAALMHDAGKRPGMSDPGHEWASANLSWGVLRTLDYPASRVQRIANLVGRHRDVSYDPRVKTTARMTDEPEHLDDLSTFYRHPTASLQLRILNESDIRSINTGSTYWHDEVEVELNTIAQALSSRGQQLNRHAVPILTSELPRRFSLITMGDKPHALLAHVSDHLEGGKFLEQLAVIESPEYSVSATLITENFRRLYNDKQGVVALVSGPVENISQAYRSNLDTGRSVTWQKHVELTRQWAHPENYRSSSFAAELDSRSRLAGLTDATVPGVANAAGAANAVSGNLGALRNLHQTVSGFDSLDELVAHHGADSPYVKAQHQVFEALTTDASGKPLGHHNEVKLNNPTLVGIGLLRNGQAVHFEDATPDLLGHLLAGGEVPPWLSSAASANTLTVPRSVWQTAFERNLPVVVLDP
jgi:hypothetical protein